MSNEKKQYVYVGLLYINKTKEGKTYLKGKVKAGGEEIEVMGFLNEFEIKAGPNKGQMAKAFSLTLNDSTDYKKDTNKDSGKITKKVDLKANKVNKEEIF